MSNSLLDCFSTISTMLNGAVNALSSNPPYQANMTVPYPPVQQQPQFASRRDIPYYQQTSSICGIPQQVPYGIPQVVPQNPPQTQGLVPTVPYQTPPQPVPYIPYIPGVTNPGYGMNAPAPYNMGNPGTQLYGRR